MTTATLKETAILFSTAMVQAIREKRKTQTRRTVKPQPTEKHKVASQGRILGGKKEEGYLYLAEDHKENVFARFPYGSVGNLLWVREEHYRFGYWKQNGLTKTGLQKWRFVANDERVCYYDNPPEEFRISRDKTNSETPQWYKRLARFMPRSACRLKLLIESYRIEKLNEISIEDSIAEGLHCLTKDNHRTFKYGITDLDGWAGACDIGWEWKEWEIDPRKAYETLWTKINGPDSWKENPYVWVVIFKVIEV